ncbi:hypothetical protein FJTKL_00932 [Diaporthe vaccinii]|uniref:Protein kinase domain-containing protein n=1 Tax=Diaporthe vaccinii TaxID=105482 RepID=A0ABR4E1U8_9PEZI
MITMPYYRSGSMAQAGIVAEEKFVTAFGQILDCLAYLHARNIIHRDLKPENILFEPAPYFKVVVSDFGLSKAIEGLGRLQTFCGTLKYAAPEIFPGTRGFGALADIWSVAVMELEWLHGIPVPPPVPLPKQGETLVPDQLSVKWMTKLRDYLNEEDSGQAVDKRRNVDGLVMCTNDKEGAVDLAQAALESDGATKDSQPSATSASSIQRQNHVLRAARKSWVGGLWPQKSGVGKKKLKCLPSQKISL